MIIQYPITVVIVNRIVNSMLLYAAIWFFVLRNLVNCVQKYIFLGENSWVYYIFLGECALGCCIYIR